MKITIILTLIILFLLGFFIYKTYGESGDVEPFILNNEKVGTSENLTLLSINMAHGRGDGRNQVLQSNELIKNYVEKIGELVKREDADVVAMQEADAPSWWSGGFSHVNYVAKLSLMRYSIQGKHVNGLGLHYGASLVTKLEVTEARSETFNMSIPTFSKGFVVATMKWDDLSFDVVSLHLDFSRASVRKEQLTLLAKKLKERKNPLVIMGDFNTDMSKKILPNFMKELNLETWKPNDKSIVTFPFLGGSRIDWVLVSSEFEIVEQTILEDVVSDHSVVRVVLKKSGL